MSAVQSPSPQDVQRHRTAMTRYALSVPMQALGRHGYLDGDRRVFDFGCGKGGDLAILEKNGVPAAGWDPHFRPDAEFVPAEVVNLGFVLNVIENREERAAALQAAYAMTECVLSVAVMLAKTADENGQQFRDGVLTSRRTFQKYFTQDELRAYIVGLLDEEPIAVGPGVFFVFKDKTEEQRFLEHRQRNRHGLDRLIQRIPKPTREEREKAFYDDHNTQLDAIWDTWLNLGRAPRDTEIPEISAVTEVFGSLSRAQNFLKRFHGDEAIQIAFASRRDDLLVFLALLEFEHHSAYRAFPEEMQYDIRAFFGSKRAAREEARALLFQAGEPELVDEGCQTAFEAGLGWLDDERALTLHTSLVPELPKLLRVYIGCASRLYGDVSSADLLKVHAQSGKLSLMNYEKFETSPLPRMSQRVKIDMRAQRIDFFEYGSNWPSPFLYWKSRYIPDDFPKYRTQKTFDERLAETKLFDFDGYGPKEEELEAGLSRARLTIKGHSLKSLATIPSLDEACGQYLAFKDLFGGHGNNGNARPAEAWVYDAFAKLAVQVLDPVMDYFGGIDLIALQWAGQDEPLKLASANNFTELRSSDATLAECINLKSSVGVQFLVQDESMLEVAQWISEHTEFHRFVFIDDSSPLAISTSPKCACKALFAPPNDAPRTKWMPSEDWVAQFTAQPAENRTKERAPS